MFVCRKPSAARLASQLRCDQSTRAPESATAFAHLAVSLAMNAPNSAGVMIIGPALFGDARELVRVGVPVSVGLLVTLIGVNVLRD